MDQLLVVKDIGSEQVYTQHVQLVKCDDDQSVQVVQQVHSSMGQAGKGLRLGNIVKHEKCGSDWWCQVHWVGHSVKDIIWESLATMAVEYPDWLKGFVKEIMDPGGRVTVEQVIVKQGLASRLTSK